jgi:hypothetical protein
MIDVSLSHGARRDVTLTPASGTSTQIDGPAADMASGW